MSSEISARFRRWILIPILFSLVGCAVPAAPPAVPTAIVDHRLGELNRAIRSLGEDIHPGEARRAARTALEYSRQLAYEYGVTDSAIIHNIKVNLGLRQQGLCVDWTRDLMARLQQENFSSLDLHWGIANYERLFRLEHSSVIISARGASLDQGLVLDPWRFSGSLFWAPVSQDQDYPWKPRAEIHALKKRHKHQNGNRALLR